MLKKMLFMFLVFAVCFVGVQSVAFGATPSVKLDKSSYNPDEEMLITVAGITDEMIELSPYITIHKVGASHNDEIDFEYITDNSETIELYSPDELGSYEVRLYREDDVYTDSAVIARIPFTVAYHSLGNLTLKLNKNNYDPGDDMILSVKGYHETMFDRVPFVGLYFVGAENDDYQEYYDISEDFEEDIFFAPEVNGSYEIRLVFEDDEHYTLISKQAFTVGGVSAPAKPDDEPVEAPQPNKPESKPQTTVNVGEGNVTVTAQSVVESGLQSAVKLQWNNTNASAYRIYRSETSGKYDNTLTTFDITTNSFIDINIEPNKTYYYIVRPVVSQSQPGAASNEAIAKTVNTVPKKANAKYILMKVDSPEMSLNGKIVEVDPGKGTSPVVTNSRVIVPIRAIVEAMGGNVGWDDPTKKITLNNKGTSVEMWIGSTKYNVNAGQKAMDVAPEIIKERTMIPLRFSTEALDSIVNWINDTKEILIIYGDK